MAYNLLIIDDFYNNPDEVREFALKQDFGVKGNYPGQRTKPFLSDSGKEHIAKHLRAIHGEPVFREDEDSYCGAFQYTTARDRTWIHADGWNKWAGVWYGTPNAPISGGTAIFKHKPTGLMRAPRLADGTTNKELLDKIYLDAQDMTKWEMVDRVGNVYNRLVLYHGDLFHASLDYFGRDINDGRLFQTFFFNTKN